ncbi:MAG: hypothetical protein ACK44A_12960 [Roseateles sp.]
MRYQLLTDRLPLAGETPALPGLTRPARDELQAMLARALQPDPARR